MRHGLRIDIFKNNEQSFLFCTEEKVSSFVAINILKDIGSAFKNSNISLHTPFLETIEVLITIFFKYNLNISRLNIFGKKDKEIYKQISELFKEVNILKNCKIEYHIFNNLEDEEAFDLFYSKYYGIAIKIYSMYNKTFYQTVFDVFEHNKLDEILIKNNDFVFKNNTLYKMNSSYELKEIKKDINIWLVECWMNTKLFYALFKTLEKANNESSFIIYYDKDVYFLIE